MRCGVDVGGTKIETAILSDSGDFLFRDRISTPKNYTAMIHASRQEWKQLIMTRAMKDQLVFVCQEAFQKKQG